ncbi:outer membrane protein assembly factor BamA [Spongiibacter taiwanensis]|uniref:outer membrane protein assembly factor BamA n=1 Tax=Spongiibacter taiwanensis TaxID=1748242 RepID=UPI0020364255|nr:outer membrane protein assembly factor BamA [Spongiibacter taiwanensis]USA42984.1 outer membrane protein assembly factor BamA [Spongiibacter taiwanensis]
MKRIVALSTFLLSLSFGVQAQTSLTITDIRVEGLQRISADTVFSALPLSVGDSISSASIANATRALFRTGNFDDIQIGIEGDVLVVGVEERPAISEINIEGNKALETEALLDGLKGAGLSEGQVFKRATLENMRLELTRQYVSQGRYDASIETDVVAQPRNRVAVSITIDEGSNARIKHINIVGNTIYDDETLLDEFELRTGGMFSWFSSADKYSREKLRGDLEKLDSYYLDRGYLRFSSSSVQVAISPNRKNVYITVNVTEGDKYKVSGAELSGDLVLPEDDLMRFVLVKEGQVFSQALVTSTEEFLTKRLGNEGYNFAKVRGIPEVDEENKTVMMKFFIDPGKRTYVRRIDFKGNSKTSDEVLRREMRQMEAAPASSDKIESGRIRLERLGFFKEAKVNTNEVAGTDDLIDLVYEVEEQSSGSLGASVGFSQDSGLLLSANIQQNNFFGSGKQVGFGVSKSQYQTSASFNYLNPYYTEDGVSRGFSIYFRSTDLEEINVASYTTDTYGASVNFGYPISEIERINFDLGVSRTEIDAGLTAVKEIITSPRLFDDVDFFIESTFNDETGGYAAAETLQAIENLSPDALTEPQEDGFLDKFGSEFDNYTIGTSYRRSTLNRGIFATRGSSQTVGISVAVPGSDLEFFKVNYEGQIYFPITNNWTFRFKTQLGYGDGYGELDSLPFFENFYAGGFGSVRGYRSNTLGPRSSPADIYSFRSAVTAVDANGNPTARSSEVGYVLDPDTGKLEVVGVRDDTDPFGGNVLIEGTIELLFPLPFVKDQRSVRSGLFFDAGNVFSTNCGVSQVNCSTPDLGKLRYSAGVGVTWLTGFGPLTFSLGRALNDEKVDETEIFQFSLGRTF